MIDGVESNRRSGRWLLWVLGCCLVLASPAFGALEERESTLSNDPRFWLSLIKQAKAAGLATRFLQRIDPRFLTLEFDDLHAFAAEYHPEDHRLILNRALSFNGAGGTLKPLAALSSREIGTLYHELFHVYLDYLMSNAGPQVDGEDSKRLLLFAEDQQQCRYQQVSITPIVQRKSRTEIRFLTERESWEALNETWAVFVGWAVWTQLELQRGSKTGRGDGMRDRWVQRLRKADQNGDLVGYYEPEASAEQSITRKRYLSPSHRITPQEVKHLLKDVLEYSAERAAQAAKAMRQDRESLPGSPPCRYS